MSKLPYMPMLVDAMLGDTLTLSTEAFGAYNLILFATWRNNSSPFPDDDSVLARVCRMSLHKWKKTRPALEPFFDLSTSHWVQKRLEKEWKLATDRASRARENGSKGGRPAAQKPKPKVNPPGSQNGNPAGNQNGTQTQSILNYNYKEEGTNILPRAEATAVILSFDRISQEVFGVTDSRPWPAHDDHVFAKRFLDTGATPAIIDDVFRSVLARFKSEGQRAPDAIRIFEKWIASAVAASNRPPMEVQHARPGRPKRPTIDDTARQNQDIIDRTLAGLNRPPGAGAPALVDDPRSDPAGVIIDHDPIGDSRR